MNTGLDRDRIEALSCALLEHIRKNYMQGPISRDRVYEALNALAFCVGTVVSGTRHPEEAKDFFDRALNMQLGMMTPADFDRFLTSGSKSHDCR